MVAPPHHDAVTLNESYLPNLFPDEYGHTVARITLSKISMTEGAAKLQALSLNAAAAALAVPSSTATAPVAATPYDAYANESVPPHAQKAYNNALTSNAAAAREVLQPNDCATPNGDTNSNSSVNDVDTPDNILPPCRHVLTPSQRQTKMSYHMQLLLSSHPFCQSITSLPQVRPQHVIWMIIMNQYCPI